jgi:hypothetical protein
LYEKFKQPNWQSFSTVLSPLLFEDSAALMMDLVRRSETFGRRFDLRSLANPHIHREAQDGIGGELMQIDVEIPEDVDNNWMKREPKPGEQQIPKDDNFVLMGLRHGLPTGIPRCPDHAVLLKGGYVTPVYQAPSEGVRLQNLLRDSIAPSLRSHDYELLRTKESRWAKGVLR